MGGASATDHAKRRSKSRAPPQLTLEPALGPTQKGNESTSNVSPGKEEKSKTQLSLSKYKHAGKSDATSGYTRRKKNKPKEGKPS